MPTSYIPYRLVHAHRPAFRRAADDHRSIAAPSTRGLPDESALVSPLHPNHAISTVRESSTGILARVVNNGYTLELDHFSFSKPRDTGSSSSASQTPLSITFADKLRPLAESCIIPYPRDSRAYILLLTETDIVYRLKLELSLDDRALLSAKGLDDWCEGWVIPEDTLAGCGGIGAWTVIDEDTMILGTGYGGIVRLTRSGKWGRSAHWSASHQRPASKFRLPSLFSRAASDELVVSTAVHDPTGPQSLAYTLSRDYRLRAWNPVSETLLRTIDLRSSFSSSQELVLRNAQSSSASGSDTALLPDSTDVPLIQVVPHPSSTSRYSHLLVIFLATPVSSLSAGTFLIYRVARASNATADLVFAGSRDCSSASVGCTIRGFTVVQPTSADHAGTGWRLAVSWEKRGSAQGETVGLDDILQFATTYETDPSSSSLSSEWLDVATDRQAVEAMDTAYFDRLISLDPPEPTEPYTNDDIARTFIEHMFHPGRFATTDLETALTEYAHQPGRRLVPQLSAPHASLSDRFEALFGCDLDMSIDAQTGAPIVDAYREALKLDWLSIWARVRDLDTHSRWPLTTCVFDDQMITFTRQGVSGLVPQDVCAVVDHVHRTDVHSVLLDSPASAFEHVYPSLISAEVRRHVGIVSSAGHHLAELLESGRREDTVVESSSSALDGLVDQVDQSLATLETEPVELRVEHLWEDHVEEHVSEHDQMMIRQTLSKSESVTDALADTLHLLGNAVDDDESNMESDRVFSTFGSALLTSTIASTVQSRYSLARSALLVAIFHVVDQAAPADSDETEASNAILNTAFTVYHRYRVLKWLCEQTGDEVQSEGSYSLLHSLLARHGAASPSTGFNLLFDASEAYLTRLDLVDPAVSDIEPREQDVVLAHDILQQGHIDAARRFTSLYPLSSGTAYVRGCALLQLGDIDEAVTLLKQAATGCHDGSLGSILPHATGPNGLSSYYAQISSLFGDAAQDGPAIYFGQLALRATPVGVTPPKSLYTRIFLSNIALGAYEDAYSTLAATPSEELKSDLLGQLISAMCENNEVGRLNALGFIGLQPKVEELLSFKARNSDPLRYPNYYKVLYSWHISRGDYRSAGEIMYKQGRRFAEGTSSKVSPFELAAMQARSYLAAINALTLVDKRNAWIALPAASRPSRVNKRRRVSSFIPQDQFSADKRAIDIITLADLQQEYTLVLSQLKLAGQVEEFADHGSSTTPEEVVGLLVQRGSFDLALSTAASLEVDMTAPFQSLSKRCVELSTLSEIAGDLSSAAFLHASPLTSRLRGSPSALALRYLHTALLRYDSIKTQYRYRQVVADTLFEVNRDKKSGWEMPGWLVHMEMERDAEGWIGRAIKWGWVAEAVGWTRDLLRSATPPELLSAKKSNVANIPYTLIDRVLAAAAEGDEKDDGKVQAAVKGLKEDVRVRIEGLEKLK